ncbi:6a09910b-1815-4def-9da6-a8ab87589a73 [Sclerotinia trifoliorum]|uniref:Box C/D snoRNA protein 1 n=1 Tax=Sclerotinia trifoliorum TaxID=28548 RepID=A0A8H2W2X7_9HELO|nr:6a09910b-1815-4def-9da6-a8ab87589a73 [Sclerotinia trifoliorum]
MADPLLSSLCRICHINPTKYTCPRCSQQTCSLPCSKRHKVWSSCSGIRDPTVYKPKAQLATPSGIDHDYNFLHSIEHRIARSEKEIVEERGLVTKTELQLAREGQNDDRRRFNKTTWRQREDFITKMLQNSGITLVKAPNGMSRNLENTSTWSKTQKCMNWQMEWIREPDTGGRILHKSIDKWSINDTYSILLEDQQRLNMAPEEKAALKKRKANELKENKAKRIKSVEHLLDIPPLSSFQNLTGAWNVVLDQPTISTDQDSTYQASTPRKLDSKYHFYLHRPKTRSSYPKVLVPLDPTQSISKVLENRTVLEFPTFYVFETDKFPDTFMLEKDYIKATGDGPEMEIEESEDEDTSGSDSSSDEDEDEDMEMEDGEIAS